MGVLQRIASSKRVYAERCWWKVRDASDVGRHVDVVVPAPVHETPTRPVIIWNLTYGEIVSARGYGGAYDARRPSCARNATGCVAL